MVTLHIPEQTARNLLEYINEYLDNVGCSERFMQEAIEDKMRIKRAIGRAEGIPRIMLNDFRLNDMVRKWFTIYAGGDIIKDIEVRCQGKLKNGRPCNRCFFVGSPGFDLRGNPKKQIVKCPKCHNYMRVRSEVEEKLIVEMIESEPYEVEGKVIVRVKEWINSKAI